MFWWLWHPHEGGMLGICKGVKVYCQIHCALNVLQSSMVVIRLVARDKVYRLLSIMEHAEHSDRKVAYVDRYNCPLVIHIAVYLKRIAQQADIILAVEA